MIKNNNIHNWKEVLKDNNSPYSEKHWESDKGFVSLLLKYSQIGVWLDVGCGLGFFVECCARFGINCEGLEGDPYAVKLAVERYPGLKIFQHDLIKKLPYKNNSISLIFCNQVLEHLPNNNTIPFLSECFRVLYNEGGVLFINMPSKYNRVAIKENTHINLMSQSELNKYLLNAGFSEIIPVNYPKFLFGNSTISKIISGFLFFTAPLDSFSNISSAIAFKNNKAKKVRGKRYFSISKLLNW